MQRNNKSYSHCLVYRERLVVKIVQLHVLHQLAEQKCSMCSVCVWSLRDTESSIQSSKKTLFSFFTPCHCYNVISVSCLAVILFSPTHLAVHKIWIGCMLLQVHIAMLRTYSCEWWFHPALHKIFFFGINTKR